MERLSFLKKSVSTVKVSHSKVSMQFTHVLKKKDRISRTDGSGQKLLFSFPGDFAFKKVVAKKRLAFE